VNGDLLDANKNNLSTRSMFTSNGRTTKISNLDGISASILWMNDNSMKLVMCVSIHKNQFTNTSKCKRYQHMKWYVTRGVFWELYMVTELSHQ
jgi:hypothetical protein